ncbi:MAG: right-handed parallel beta-helix repeat-containing protein [Myxococcota bacterium]
MDCTIKVLLAPAAATFVSLLALAHPAVAVDGVIEINHAKALAGGVTASDTPGYPVTIDRAGSYRLTGNLTVPNENTSGITVSANDVGIDLNNFAIIGPVTCSGSPLTCSHSSTSGTGIRGLSIGTSVKNGSITGMGYWGVVLQEQAEVTNLRLRWNRNTGIHASMGSKISGNTVYQNGAYGIVAGDGSTVSGNTAFNNGNHGISAKISSMVSGNTAYSNGGDGIELRTGSTVSGNTIYGNTGYGINFTFYSGAYSGNVISNNTAGTVNGTAVEFGQNVCNGSTTCP